MKMTLVGKGERKGIVFNPENKATLTIGQIIDPLIEINNEDEMREYYQKYIQWIAEVEMIGPEEAATIAHRNIGYLLGYYSTETRMRIERILNVAHPFLGKAKEKEYTPDQILQLGMSIAQQEKLK